MDPRKEVSPDPLIFYPMSHFRRKRSYSRANRIWETILRLCRKVIGGKHLLLTQRVGSLRVAERQSQVVAGSRNAMLVNGAAR
jgi:hypothetical protein